MGARVLAIVVCYNPSRAPLSVSLSALDEQVEAVLVIDNASLDPVDIEHAIADSRMGSAVNKSRIKVLRQAHNLGLGAAYNLGAEYARQAAFSHILLLDQDSVPLKDMVRKLLAASDRKQPQRLSAVGATYLHADNGSESFFVQFGKLKFRRRYCAQRDADGCVEADFLISSGSLIRLASMDSIGEMDETLFIDHVDTEWFLRARARGFHAFGVCDAVMQHGLGEQTHRISLGYWGRQRNVPQHKPFRYYYIFRNSIILYRRSYPSGWWKWNDLQRLVMIAVMYGIFKSPRRQNAKMMLKGIVDGVRGVHGKIDFG